MSAVGLMFVLLGILILNIVWPSAVMLGNIKMRGVFVITLSANMLSANMLSANMLSANMLSENMLSVIMMSAIMLSVVMASIIKMSVVLVIIFRVIMLSFITLSCCAFDRLQISALVKHSPLSFSNSTNLI
jgi:hypothetical protein